MAANEVVVHCSIPRKHYYAVIGVGGGNIAALGIEHSVSFQLPGDHSMSIEPPGFLAAKSAAGAEIGAGPGDNASAHLDSGYVDILVKGRIENCQRAREAILALIPNDPVAVAVPLRLRPAIFGPNHVFLQAMRNRYEVRIELPLNRDFLHVVGPSSNCARAADALLERVKELQEEEKGKDPQVHREVVQVSREHHAHILASRRPVITKIREKHEVDFVFNYNESPQQFHDILIVGREHQTRAAREEFLQMLWELEAWYATEVDIDHRVHGKLFGPSGKVTAKVQDLFKVAIEFPQDKTTNKLRITGKRNNVEDATEHLLILADCFMADLPGPVGSGR